MLVALALISVIIPLGSQTEGRFLEDPYLWLAAGLAVAVEGIMRARPRAVAPPTNAALDGDA